MLDTLLRTDAWGGAHPPGQLGADRGELMVALLGAAPKPDIARRVAGVMQPLLHRPRLRPALHRLLMLCVQGGPGTPTTPANSHLYPPFQHFAFCRALLSPPAVPMPPTHVFATPLPAHIPIPSVPHPHPHPHLPRPRLTLTPHGAG